MRSRINSEILVLARLSRSRSQATLASDLKISQGQLSKFEHGSLYPSPDIVAAIARELEYPESFFSRPERVRGSDSICFHHRKRKSMSARLLATTEGRMYVTQLQIHGLIEDLEIETANEFFTLDPDDYDGTPRTVAKVLRGLWRLPPGPVPSLTRVVEAAGGIVVRRDFGTTKLDGMSCWPAKGRPLFFLNAQMPIDRMRLTLAHELGHLVMHATPPSGDPEAEANEFALEFLAPAAEIDPDLRNVRFGQLAGLKAYWGLSMNAIIMAGRRSGAIPEGKSRSLYVQMSTHGYRRVEPYPLDWDETPATIDKAVKVYLDDLNYSPDELATLTGLLPDEFWQLYMRQAEEPKVLRVLP